MSIFDGRGPTKKSDVVAVLDIGSSKIVCFIGREEPGFGVRLIGAGYHASVGIKHGAVIDMDTAEHTIRSAVEKAEREAGVTVSSVAVCVSTRSLSSQHITVETPFASGAVADRDLKRVLDSSLDEFNEPDHAILHALPLNWLVDDERGIDDPRGMYGQRLGVDMHFVTAGLGMLRNLAHCVERCHLQISAIVAAPFAAGEGVLTEDELDLGVTVIDLGGGLTTSAVFRDRTLAFVDAVPVGGRNVTTDVARGLTTPFEAAERIKSLYGSALEGREDHLQTIPCPPMGAQDELHYEPRALLTAIIRARMEETFEILRGRLKSAGIESYAGRRIVLTGGGANLSGAAELAESIFGKRVRVGKPHGVLGLPDTMSGPEFASAAGLLKHVMTERSDVMTGPPDLSGRRNRRKRYSGSGLARSWQWLRENF